MDYDDWMSASDAIVWQVERDPVLRSTISSVWFLDQRPDDERFRASVQNAIDRIPRMRQRVLDDRLGMAVPRWVDDDQFDIGQHVYIDDLATAPSEPDVMEFAGSLHSQPFDRERPLWQLHLRNGPPGEPSAIVMKLHHAIADGLGLIQMVGELVQFDRDELAPARSRREPDGPSDVRHPLADAVAHRVMADTELATRAGAAAVRNLARMAIHPLAEIRRSTAATTSIARSLKPSTAPMSELMRNRSQNFALSSTSRHLDDIRAAAKAAGGTINDLFVAAVVGAVQHYHHQHDTSTEQLRVMMPISIRAEGDDTAGNQFVPTRFLVPGGIADPTERIRTMRERLLAERAEPALGMYAEVAEVVQRLGPQAATAVLAGMMKASDVTASNVPGVDVPLFMAGAQIERIVPCGPCAGSAINTTLLTYDGQATIGITTDRAAIPDKAQFASCLDQSLDEMLTIAP